MSDFSDNFEFGPRKSGSGLIAEGDWFGDEVEIMTANGVPHDGALATLADLYRNWRAWKSDLQDAIDNAHGDPGDYWLEAITAHKDGRFEIEFSAPDLFDDDLGIAVGTLKNGFEDVSISS